MNAAVQRVMGPWEMRVRDYLAFRKQLGFSLRTSGVELKSFARHLEAIGHHGPLTTEVAVRWARQPTEAKPEYWAWRLKAVRMFAKHLAVIDARHQVPAAGTLGRAYTRRDPHIYTPGEICALLEAAQTVKPAWSLAPDTYRTYFGLLATTGLRAGEALSLRREQVDLTQGRLLEVKGKLGKIRALPLHPTTVDALRAYADRRDAAFPTPRRSEAFFLTRRGTALNYTRVELTFRTLRRRLGWGRYNPTPRVHDLRHYPECRIIPRRS